jgi:hypothetical protein
VPSITVRPPPVVTVPLLPPVAPALTTTLPVPAPGLP